MRALLPSLQILLVVIIVAWNVVLSTRIAQVRALPRPFAFLTALAGFLLLPALAPTHVQRTPHGLQLNIYQLLNYSQLPKVQQTAQYFFSSGLGDSRYMLINIMRSSV